jgi:hypothetical protein
MKTLLLSFFFLISTLTSFGQESKIRYMRAHTVSMGIRPDENSAVSSWILDGQECNILIELHPTKVIIYSKKTQTYRIVSQLPTEGNTLGWFCKDEDGISCHFKMTADPQYPGFMALAVEYDDAIWFYIASHE